MLIIRLQRTGKKHQPVFRVVLAEKHKSVSKKFIEILGIYNPRNKEFSIKEKERLDYWLAQKVEVSPTVHNLLVTNKLVDESKVKSWQPKKKEKPAEVKSAPVATPAPDVAPSEAKEEEPVEKVAEESVEPEVSSAEVVSTEEPSVEKTEEKVEEQPVEKVVDEPSEPEVSPVEEVVTKETAEEKEVENV